jgi:hypothetical protein
MLQDVFNQVNYGGMTVLCPYCHFIHKLQGKKLQNIITEHGYTIFVCDACGMFIILDVVPIDTIPNFDVLKGDK